jgi:hypothetical protein
MKKAIVLLVLFSSMEAGSTHWFTYYIFVETEYVQGPWSRTQLLSESGYRYLAPRVFEDLFGTMKEELAGKLLERLREEKPSVYDRNLVLSLRGDTVCLEINGNINRPETVMNEVTTTMILNSFSAVCFKYSDREVTWSLADLTLPYFDLVSAPKIVAGGSGKQLTADPATGDSRNPLAHWLILSVLLNLILILFIVFKAKK